MNMNKPYRCYPLRLSYLPHAAPWGGDRLASRYGKSGPSPLAETWELSVRDADMSIIENGPCAGMPLARYLADSGRGEGRFPLLVKFIDAAQPLSVQVHPDDAYAAAHECDGGKSELWVILSAEEGARLTLGLRPGVDREMLARALRDGSPEPLLRTVEVRSGDSFFIPAGLVHAIGAGITLAEIQQNSDLTYRLWDYNRPGLDGHPRPLHIAQALAAMHDDSDAEIAALRFSRPASLPGECLCATAHFTVSRLRGEAVLSAGARFLSLLCVDGEGRLIQGGEEYPFAAGQSWLLPAGCAACRLTGNAEVLISCPG